MGEVLIDFTSKNTERLLREGGTGDFHVNRARAQRCEYVIATRNANSDWVEGPEPHGSAFMIFRGLTAVPSPGRPGRSRMMAREFARISIPNIWPGGRNPVHYAPDLATLGIDAATLPWEPMPEPAPAPSPPLARDHQPAQTLVFDPTPPHADLVEAMINRGHRVTLFPDGRVQIER